MFKTLFDFILNRKGHPVQTDSVAPYKVETPAAEAPTTKVEPVKCGCGRSPSGYCVGLHSLTAEEWNAHPANPAPVVAAAPEAKPAAKATPKVGKTAAKSAKAADAKKKPAAMKAPAKPRAKKAKE